MTVIRKLETVSVIRIETTAGGVEYFLPDGTRLGDEQRKDTGMMRLTEPAPSEPVSGDALSVLDKLKAVDPSFAGNATRSLGLNGSG